MQRWSREPGWKLARRLGRRLAIWTRDRWGWASMVSVAVESRGSRRQNP